MNHRDLGVSLVFLLAGGAAQAEIANSDASNGENALETVVVTADRRSENLRDVPISVGVVSASMLDQIDVNGQDIRWSPRAISAERRCLR